MPIVHRFQMWDVIQFQLGGAERPSAWTEAKPG
jgi:hypothetical protein